VRFHFSWVQIHTTEIPKIRYQRQIKIPLYQKKGGGNQRRNIKKVYILIDT